MNEFWRLDWFHSVRVAKIGFERANDVFNLKEICLKNEAAMR